MLRSAARNAIGDDDHDDCGDSQTEDQPVEVHAHVRIGAAGNADGQQGRRRDRPEHGDERAADCDQQHSWPACQHTLGARDAERAQRRLIDAHLRELTGQHDPDRDDPGESGHSGEDPQSQRQHVDRVLRPDGSHGLRTDSTRRPEDPPGCCGDARHVRGTMARSDEHDDAEVADAVDVRAVERRGQDDDAFPGAVSAEITEVEGPPHDPHDAQTHPRTQRRLAAVRRHRR